MVSLARLAGRDRRHSNQQSKGLQAKPHLVLPQVKEMLSEPSSPARQGAGAIHVHPNGRFVYLTNRAAYSRARG